MLPIVKYVDQITQQLRTHSSVILSASPGSGKTTALPKLLSNLTDKKILVLEPRRLAAKMAAIKIASDTNTEIGEFVGYVFRKERKLSANTKIIFLTEGTFLRFIAHSPNLQDFGLIILDEFHERHWQTDIALNIVSHLIKTVRHDLKLLIMSATINADELFTFLPNCSKVEIEAEKFPLQIEYLSNTPSILNRSLEIKVCETLENYQTKIKSALVFLNGMSDILRVKQFIEDRFHHFKLYILHGELTKDDQEKVFNSNEARIILSTNIAESSVTIPGVNFVIDAGTEKVNVFSPWSGTSKLETKKITQFSAIQRAARASRSGPGYCVRLYSELDFLTRPEHQVPEILRTDFTEILLFLKSLKFSDITYFCTPTEAQKNHAYSVLKTLHAIDENGDLTPRGEEISRIDLSPRIALIAFHLSHAIAHYSHEEKMEIKHLLKTWLDDDDVSKIFHWAQKNFKKTQTEKKFGQILLEAFFDQLCISQNDCLLLSNGTKLKIAPQLRQSYQLDSGLWIILEADLKQTAQTIFPIEIDWLYDIEPFPIEEGFSFEFNEESDKKCERPLLKQFEHIGKIQLESKKIRPIYHHLSSDLKKNFIQFLLKNYRSQLSQLETSSFFTKIEFFKHFYNMTNEELTQSNQLIETCLKDFLEIQTDAIVFDSSFFENFQTFIEHSFINQNDHHFLQNFSQRFPSKIRIGQREYEILYSKEQACIEAPIQDFYGQKETPHIDEGKIPLTINLLGPHGRPVQKTNSLTRFWKNTYQELKKEFQRDYPKHYWPDNPESAIAVRLKSHLK